MPPKNSLQFNHGDLYILDTGGPMQTWTPIGTVNGELRDYINTDISLTKRQYEMFCNGNFEKGEVMKAMRNNDILVKVGNKYYNPYDIAVNHDLSSVYPSITLSARFSPSQEVTAKESTNPFAIKDVIFNNPATIVLWDDGTKTVVKTQNGEEYDPEKGLAMAIAKKALGNNGNYFDVFKMFIKKNEERMAKEQKKEEKTRDELDDTIVQFLKCIFGNGVGHPEE